MSQKAENYRFPFQLLCCMTLARSLPTLLRTLTISGASQDHSLTASRVKEDLRSRITHQPCFTDKKTEAQ